MKKFFLLPFLSVLAVILFTACFKKEAPCNGLTVERDRQIIDSTIDRNDWNNLTWDASKSIYTGTMIMGTGSLPLDDSLVTFDYIARYINGARIERIDSTRYPTINQTPISLKTLNTSDPGLYAVLTKLREGGMYREIIPSSAAYGCRGAGVVPANSQIITDIRLVEVKQP